MTDWKLGIFARAPIAGQTKTRLAARLGDDQAVAVYRDLVAATCRAARAARAEIVVHYTPDDDQTGVRRMIGEPDWTYVPQVSGDLGTKMLAAFETTPVLIGTDCPSLSGSLLEQAFEQLSEHDLVLGPAEDGGYYLIGVSRVDPGLFDGVAWSTDQVRRRTLQNAQAIGWNTSQLKVLRDVDTYEDYRAWQA